MEDFEQTPKMAEWPNEKLTVEKNLVVGEIKRNHTITFHRLDENGWSNGELVGTLDFNGPKMKFEGEAEEGARVFFDYVAKFFEQRLKMEYDRGYEDAKQQLGSQK